MAKWNPKKDPHSDRESAKYDNPVPSREFILEYLQSNNEPTTLAEFCAAFSIDDDQLQQKEALRRRLRAMERDGQLMRNRKGAYGLISKLDLVLGRVRGHRDGYGFLLPDDGSEDLYLTSRQMRGVFDGDKALARVSGVDKRGRKEGAIVEVIERNTTSIVGRFYEESGVCFVAPDNKRICQDIAIPPHAKGSAKSGQFVVVKLTVYPDYRQQAQGEIAEVLGDHMAPGLEIDVAMRAHDIPHVWPDEVSDQAAELDSEVAEEDKKHRVDLRDMPLVTIDGEDARDFDDAVYCEKKPGGGWKLLVAIADVSHYVAVSSALDEEAERRGNSVYFPERVIPMLPEALSNGLCSLNPDVDRLCMVCEMSISAKGKMTRFKFFEGVMRSHARLTYTQVGNFISGDNKQERKDFLKSFSHVADSIQRLHDLYLVLHQAREERGAIDFDTTETRIIFGEDRKIQDIVPVVRNDAHRLIEECMLCANVAAAKVIEKYKLPAVYRVHLGPKDEKLSNLRAFLGGLGLDLGGQSNPEPKDYQILLQSVADRPDAHIIQTVMLRSLSQANYTPDNQGHFGLGYVAYAHFTSPIRRYPDLLLHRALRYLIRTESDSPNVHRVPGSKRIAKKDWLPYDTERMIGMGDHCSMTERRADDATRDSVDWLKCEYMVDHVEEIFDGVISAVTAFGIFVELKGIYVEGLVHVTSLKNDYYHFDAVRHRLSGERTGTEFGLGDEVVVRVIRVDLDDKKIDFELIETKSRRRKSRKPQKSADGSGRSRLQKSFKEKAKAEGKKEKREKVIKKTKAEDVAKDVVTQEPEVDNVNASVWASAKKQAAKPSGRGGAGKASGDKGSKRKAAGDKAKSGGTKSKSSTKGKSAAGKKSGASKPKKKVQKQLAESESKKEAKKKKLKAKSRARVQKAKGKPKK